MNKIAIKRGNTVVMELPIDDKAVYSARMMGETYIETTLGVKDALQLQIGDRLLHEGVEFVLFEEPDHEHQDGVHTYPIRFHAPCHVFGFVKHKHRGAIDISYCGTLEKHVALLLADVQQAAADSGATASCYQGFRVEWGTVDKSAVQHIEFGDTTCLEALGKICETYGLEYRFSGKSLYLSPADQPADPDAALPAFEYGKGKGLYSLERQGISNENVATRLYVYGSDRNLPADYRKDDDPRPTRLTVPNRCLDANTALYGVREQTATNDEIFPCLKEVRVIGTPKIADKICTFRIRFAKAEDVFELADNVIRDREPKVSFTTGALAGEEFSVLKGGWRTIDPTTREIDVIRSEIEYDGATHYLPSDERRPAEGDEFVLLDINMPAQYIARAEAELLEWGLKQLEKKSVRQYGYKLEIDPRYVKREGIRLAPGDRIRITDEGTSRVIRISEVTYPLAQPSQLRVELSDIRIGTLAEKIEKEIEEVTGSVQEVHRQTGALSRRAWRDAQEVADMVEALSAPGLITGDAEGQFTCSSIIRCNVDGNPNKIVVTDGELKHALHAPAGGSDWKITGGESLLDTAEFPLDQPFYLYAVCPLANHMAYIAAVKTAPVEEQPVHRFFRIGVLSSVYDTTDSNGAASSRRTFNYTNRFSQIVGGNITTSVISDPARRLVIDLDNACITANDGAQIRGRVELTGSTIDGKTVIEGGRIKAESIDTDNLTVRQLQTSNADKRIVISKKDHNITMYNDADQMRLEISGETKADFNDIVDTGGEPAKKMVQTLRFSESAEAMLSELSSTDSNSASSKGSHIAYGPFTIRGSVKPSMTFPSIQPQVRLEADLLKEDWAEAHVEFSIVVEKQDDTGSWTTYQHLGTHYQSRTTSTSVAPSFCQKQTLHNLLPGTYRIVYVYALESRIIRLQSIPIIREPLELEKLAIPITTLPMEETDGSLSADDSSFRPEEPYEPVKPPIWVPIDPDPIDPKPVDPPMEIIASHMKASLEVPTYTLTIEYSILRTSIFANGMASVWDIDKYFRILDGSETNLIETRGTTQMLSQNGYHGLQITDTGMLVRYQNAPWSGMMPGVDYIGHVTSIGTFRSQWRAPGKNAMVVSRVMEGFYRITFSPSYTYNSDYIVLVSSFYGYGCTNSRTPYDCELYLGDDASANDAEFYFIILNVKNYLG